MKSFLEASQRFGDETNTTAQAKHTAIIHRRRRNLTTTNIQKSRRKRDNDNKNNKLKEEAAVPWRVQCDGTGRTNKQNEKRNTDVVEKEHKANRIQKRIAGYNAGTF